VLKCFVFLDSFFVLYCYFFLTVKQKLKKGNTSVKIVCEDGCKVDDDDDGWAYGGFIVNPFSHPYFFCLIEDENLSLAVPSTSGWYTVFFLHFEIDQL
jgi:hypothetical protein